MKTIALAAALFVSAFSLSPADDGILTAQPPVELTGTKGKFDFIKIDAANRRLLACHTGNGSLDVIDIDKSALVKSIPTGAAQGVAIDEKGGRYFVSCSKPPKLVIVNAKTLEITGEVPLPGPADLCAFVGDCGVLVDSDEKPEQWEIILPKKSIFQTRTFTGTGLEDLGESASRGFYVQLLKDSSQINVQQVVFAFGGSAMAKMMANANRYFSTLPAEKPHGLAMLKNECVLIAGGTGKLALMNLIDGKILASCDIAPHVDEIAYDAGTGRVYCASGTGTISVVFVQHDKLTPLPALTSAPGAHSIAVDPKNHSVWIAYAKGDKPCVQQYAGK